MKIAIVDDKPYLRRALREKIAAADSGIHIIMEAADGADFLEKMKQAAEMPDAVLMDIEMPELNGIEAVQIASALYPKVKFIMLTVIDDDDRIFQAIKAGAHGYLLKEDETAQIVDALRQVYEDDGAPMSPSIARKAWKWLTSLPEKPVVSQQVHYSAEDLEPLSAREKEVLQACMEGKDYEQIAKMLFLSRHTVRQHMKNIYKKLHVRSKVEALQIGLKNRWI